MKLTSLGFSVSAIALLALKPIEAQELVDKKESLRFYEGVLVEPISGKKISVKLNSALTIEVDHQKIILQENKICRVGSLELPSFFCNLAWFDMVPPASLLLNYLKVTNLGTAQNVAKTAYSLNDDGSLSCRELEKIPAHFSHGVRAEKIWENIVSRGTLDYGKIIDEAIVVSYSFPRLIKPIISSDGNIFCGLLIYNLVTHKASQWLFQPAVFINEL